MKKLIIALLITIPTIVFSQTEKKVLMVVSSYGKDTGETRPGYEMDEFSQAYLIFKENGLNIDVASPKGGAVEADQFNKDKPYNQSLLADEWAMGLLDNTKPTATIDAKNYDAIYVVGGKGAMFDIPFDPHLQDIIQDLYEREGTVISAVCHGPAAFVNVKSDGEFIIKGVEMTGFCNAEEELFGKKWVSEFPWLLEDKVKERGANFQQADFMLAKTIVSGKFITGQNPFSTAGSAEEVVTALGIEPVKRELYHDERSIYLVQDLLNNDLTRAKATKELKKNTDDYDIELMAVYGYYKILAAAENKEELQRGVDIIELTSPHYYNENLQLALAKTYVKLEQRSQAKKILEELIEKDLAKDKAEKILAEIMI